MFDQESEKPTHLVAYSDGGCWQDLRIGGWGVHGYFYINEPAKTGTGCKKAQLTPAGYVLGSGDKPTITVTHYVDAFGSLPELATNNIAELTAAIRSLKLAIDSGVKHILLLSDSKYVLQGMTEWLPGWIRNNWVASTGQPVANKDYWIQVKALLDQLKEKGIEFKFTWVKGHSGNFGNEIVDKFASLAMRAAMNGRPIDELKITGSKGYWKTAKAQSRLLNMPSWYFGVREDASVLSEDNRTIYYQGDLRQSEEFNGKMISDACFSVLYLTAPDPVLETVRRESVTLAKASFYGLAVGNLPLLFKPENYEMIEEHGTKFLTYDLSKNRLMTHKKEVLVEERRPVRRAYYAVDRLQQLEKILLSFLRQEPDSGYSYTPVTDLLYETVVAKKSEAVKLRAHVTQSLKTLEAEVTFVGPSKRAGGAKVQLVLGQDLPDRNTLSALAGEGVAVYVVTWAESESIIRFATIVQTTDDVGIWSGVYSNLHILSTAA